ncbi:unnamed protein product [Vitrella brassicaformis CCMP3155]|uniref:F-actin-capping protein subunit alpha n=1 Tax=Vitrella brassicaformis (strain CCMP3155) TaxID=1169540 RepID=A0A0G4EUX4_VITBC|nr:unnamed protein product [Vitrella brassicaformis CCMP3155]|mmetsp:Transcript_21377/g.60925  ORF Transcript_21377/g.60925 Transcript_21377/m.60925 type:complete len:336 (+) Transcript_21377:59-1066(+)|eukprot:CEM02255.1 unnamed protein product [Vitrella brassicaformis CCMP3155]
MSGGGSSSISVEEKRRIVRYIMLNSPPGQTQEVLTDCRKLLQNDPEVLSESALSEILAEHNEQKLLAVRLPQSNLPKGIVCRQGRLADRLYLEPRTKHVFEVAHITQTVAGSVTAAEPSQLPTRAEPYRAALDTAMDGYIATHYYPDEQPLPTASGGTSGVAHAVYGVDEGKDAVTLHVVISAKNQNLKNYWAGGWASQWSITFTPNQTTSAKLKGSASVLTHFFEEGNVQMHADNDMQADIQPPDLKSAESLSSAVAKAISTLEGAFHQSMEDKYAACADRAFKSLRRTLPITMEKFDWSPLKHVIRKDLTERTHPQATHATAAAPVAGGGKGT